MYVGKQDSAVLKASHKRVQRLERKAPFGPWMTWEDYLRGHKDDFLGDLIQDEYTQNTNAGGTIALQDGAHGGVVRLACAAGAGSYAYLWLGDAAGGYDTLDADEGWVMAMRACIQATTNALNFFGVYNVALGHYIEAGFYSVSGANWFLRGSDGAAWSVQGVTAADTDWHRHALEVRPHAGGRRVRYYVDGNIEVERTANIPATVLTPLLGVYVIGATARWMDVDVWDTIPRNLA